MFKRGLAGLAFCLFSAVAPAATIGYYTANNSGTTAPAAGITAAGHTAVQITDVSTFDFNTIQRLVINNSDNGGVETVLVNRAADLATFVGNGGILFFHDRFVSPVEDVATTGHPVLPGSGSIDFVRSFIIDADIDFVTSSGIDNGLFGILNNSSLDGGSSSTHGYVTASTLPAGAVVYMSNGNAAQAVGFSYGYGSGTVYYSTIPLDFYLGGSGPAAVQQNMVNIYYPNLLSANEFGGGGVSQIPEPATFAMLGAGILAIGLLRRRSS